MNVSIGLIHIRYIVLGIDPKDIKSIQWYQMLGEISVLLDAQVDENKKI